MGCGLSRRWAWSSIIAGIAVLGASGTALAQQKPAEALAVEITNTSEPVLCAEKDNVTLNLSSVEVKKFRIEAAHPSYIGTLQRDSFEADWTGCTAPDDPKAGPSAPPQRTTLYEDIEMWVIGLRLSQPFWRPSNTTVRIGDRVEKGIHLLQVWTIRPMGGEEVLVLYPQDGYWRARPKAPAGLAPTAFGSSFLIGPVEVDGRPIVKIKEVAFDPKQRTFTLAFEQGGSARVRMSELDANHHVLDVSFDKAIQGKPFAALRSMYVTEFNNDVARVAVRERGARGWREEPVLKFGRATASDLWAGRVAPSRHNTSSPDMVFKGFGK